MYCPSPTMYPFFLLSLSCGLLERGQVFLVFLRLPPLPPAAGSALGSACFPCGASAEQAAEGLLRRSGSPCTGDMDPLLHPAASHCVQGCARRALPDTDLACSHLREGFRHRSFRRPALAAALKIAAGASGLGRQRAGRNVWAGTAWGPRHSVAPCLRRKVRRSVVVPELAPLLFPHSVRETAQAGPSAAKEGFGVARVDLQRAVAVPLGVGPLPLPQLALRAVQVQRQLGALNLLPVALAQGPGPGLAVKVQMHYAPIVQRLGLDRFSRQKQPVPFFPLSRRGLHPFRCRTGRSEPAKSKTDR